MTREFDQWGRSVDEWLDSLVAEAAKDLVFVFNITQMAIGQFECKDDELPQMVEHAAAQLLKNGAIL